MLKRRLKNNSIIKTSLSSLTFILAIPLAVGFWYIPKTSISFAISNMIILCITLIVNRISSRYTISNITNLFVSLGYINYLFFIFILIDLQDNINSMLYFTKVIFIEFTVLLIAFGIIYALHYNNCKLQYQRQSSVLKEERHKILSKYTMGVKYEYINRVLSRRQNISSNHRSIVQKMLSQYEKEGKNISNMLYFDKK